jgi:hypothetical protein
VFLPAAELIQERTIGATDIFEGVGQDRKALAVQGVA